MAVFFKQLLPAREMLDTHVHILPSTNTSLNFQEKELYLLWRWIYTADNHDIL